MSDLLKLIQERKSGRAPFDPQRPVAKEDLRKILEAGRWAPTAHNMQNFEIAVVDDKKLLAAIGGIEQPASEEFIRENYQQLSFSEDELRRKKVGLLAAMFPESWRKPDAKPEADSELASRFGRAIQAGPTLLVVLYDPKRRAPASEGDFLGIISLGCVMENMWLMASSLGIAFHVISVLSAPPVEKKVKALLGIPKHLTIAFAVRVGYLASPPGSPLRVRREVEDFTHHNRYGKLGLD
jgi:nitroreductase